MTKELQDLAWSVLPKEFKEEVKKVARIYSGRTSALFGAERHLTNKFLDEFIGLFGHHNLTSDAEGEEMLTVSRKQLLDAFNSAKIIGNSKMSSKMLAGAADMCINTFKELFGSKCLPDDTNLSEKLTGSEPKFRKDEKVRIKGVAGFDVIKAIYGTGKDGYRYELVNEIAIYDESDLEPYTEPKDESRNLSQETANCDKQFDNILKDSFREHNRLHIATEMAAAIIQSTDDITIDNKQVQKNLENVAKVAFLFADALISECGKGGSDGED